MDQQLEEILQDAMKAVNASELIPGETKQEFAKLIEAVRSEPTQANVEVLDVVLEFFENLERSVANVAETDLAILDTKIKQAERELSQDLG